MRAAAYFFFILTAIATLSVVDLVRHGNPDRPGAELPVSYYLGAALVPLATLVIGLLALRAADRQRRRFQQAASDLADEETRLRDEADDPPSDAPKPAPNS